MYFSRIFIYLIVLRVNSRVLLGRCFCENEYSSGSGYQYENVDFFFFLIRTFMFGTT